MYVKLTMSVKNKGDKATKFERRSIDLINSNATPQTGTLTKR